MIVGILIYLIGVVMMGVIMLMFIREKNEDVTLSEFLKLIFIVLFSWASVVLIFCLFAGEKMDEYGNNIIVIKKRKEEEEDGE